MRGLVGLLVTLGLLALVYLLVGRALAPVQPTRTLTIPAGPPPIVTVTVTTSG